jgi:hypothetical protein
MPFLFPALEVNEMEQPRSIFYFFLVFYSFVGECAGRMLHHCYEFLKKIPGIMSCRLLALTRFLFWNQLHRELSLWKESHGIWNRNTVSLIESIKVAVLPVGEDCHL